MSAAWEWRGFSALSGETDLTGLATNLMHRVGMSLSSEVVHEHDTYLALPRVPHNLKIRNEALEIKIQVKRLAGGFSLWKDKEIWTFPLQQEQSERLFSWTRQKSRVQVPSPGSPEELIKALGHHTPGFGVVPVSKRRVRLTVSGGTRLEIADLSLPGGLHFLSYCVDGYDLNDVKSVVRRSGLRSSTRALSYVDLIHEALWWHPALRRNEVAG